MTKRMVRLPDGRRLVFYEFPDSPPRAEAPERPDAPAPPGPAQRPAREER